MWRKYNNNARYTFCYSWQVSLKNILWKILFSVPLKSTLEWGFFCNPAYDCMSIQFAAPLFFEVTTSAWTFLLRNDGFSSRYLDWMQTWAKKIHFIVPPQLAWSNRVRCNASGVFLAASVILGGTHACSHLLFFPRTREGMYCTIEKKSLGVNLSRDLAWSKVVYSQKNACHDLQKSDLWNLLLVEIVSLNQRVTQK